LWILFKKNHSHDPKMSLWNDKNIKKKEIKKKEKKKRRKRKKKIWFKYIRKW